MKIVDCKQGDEKWLALHRVMATASSFDKIVTAKTGKLSASIDKLCFELIAGKMAPNRPTENKFMSAAMSYGVACESEARAWYEFTQDVEVQQVGFITTDDGHFGCSPDGYIPAIKRGLEIKCPNLETHLRYLYEGVLPDEYIQQVHGNLVVAEFESMDFVSYCPDCPRQFRIRVTPNKFTETLRLALGVFWERLQLIEAKILGADDVFAGGTPSLQSVGELIGAGR